MFTLSTHSINSTDISAVFTTLSTLIKVNNNNQNEVIGFNDEFKHFFHFVNVL